MITLADAQLEVSFDSSTGVFRKIYDKKHGVVLAENSLNEAFILEYSQNNFTNTFERFECIEAQAGHIVMEWTVEQGIKLHAKVQLKDGELLFRAEVQNDSKKLLASIEYPLLDGINRLSGANDYLAHAYATGYLINNPFNNFENDGDGMRHIPYPEGFSGATMQFFTYYANKKTGLLFAAYDGEFHQKWLNFYKQGGKLRASQIFGYEDIGCGKSLKMNWDFAVRLTNGDGWYEAADIYKEWALKQKWCEKGLLKDLPESQKAVWLLEKTGAATFGINACHDRTKWIERYSQDIQAPIFHILGPDWPKVDQNYVGSLPGGYDDWFPTRFSQENIDVMRKYDGRFAPFEFDFLLAVDKSDSEEIQNSLQKWPENPKARDAYTFNMLCPVCDYTKQLHVSRDRRVVQESGCDAMYYDISANNIIKTCMSEDHGHAVGAGYKMTEAYRDIYEETRSALCEDTQKYIPLGTEMINETLIDKLDYYQARANAQPCSTLETWPFRHLLKSGKSELVPMFQYVYGGYAPLRLDGWGKLTDEGGDIIYHTIAKTYLWGGLFEINSEYSPMEAIDGDENSSKEHYCNFAPRGYAYRNEIAEYIRKFAALRTGEFNQFLAYGEMLRPPVVACRKVYRSYLQYNHGQEAAEQNDQGIILLDSVIAALYRVNGRTALFIANTTAFRQKVTLTTGEVSDEKTCLASMDYDYGAEMLAELPAKKLLALTLQPYQLVAAIL